jgi:IS5 family transposase
VLQRLFNISDDQTEYQVKDRMSFMRFLGLTLGNRVPDAKTIWLFRENLTKADVLKELFDLFTKCLESQGLITRTGSIVDASFVDAPRQRNSREENKKIKEKEIPKEWEKPENINKFRQKDTDARWTKKGNETHYGYYTNTLKKFELFSEM